MLNTGHAVDVIANNAANMLLSTGGAGASGFQNDADGNTLVGNGRTNAWNSQNRLVSCLIGGNTTAYKYGADGLRRQKTTNGTSTDYAYDATMMVREGHAAGGSLTASTVTATYFQGASGPCYRRDDTATELDSQGRTVTKARWYVYDGLGSVVGEVDPLGNLTSSPKYDVYGATRSNGGTATSKQGFVGSLGHVSDDTGLVYMRARYMDPQTGRFVSEDPAMDGLNWYIYCEDNPVNRADPSGKTTLCGELDYDEAVGKAGFGALGAVLLIIAGYMATEELASNGLFLTKGAKQNTGKNQAENDWTNYLKQKYHLSKDEGRQLHDTITGMGMSKDEIEAEAKGIVKLRGGDGDDE